MQSKPTLNSLVIETDRLFLKEITPDIIYKLFTFYNDEEIMQFLGLESENELEMERMKFEGGRTTYRTSFKNFLLIDKATNRVIGGLGFHNWYPQHFRSEIGYHLNESHRNKGLMTEALKTAIEFGFSGMDLNRIEAFTSTKNIASQKLLSKLGFKQEGMLRQHYFFENRLEDDYCYALLKQEYRS
jgi:ribosomal-protein-alanine N-acetyltransferase